MKVLSCSRDSAYLPPEFEAGTSPSGSSPSLLEILGSKALHIFQALSLWHLGEELSIMFSSCYS